MCESAPNHRRCSVDLVTNRITRVESEEKSRLGGKCGRFMLIHLHTSGRIFLYFENLSLALSFLCSLLGMLGLQTHLQGPEWNHGELQLVLEGF